MGCAIFLMVYLYAGKMPYVNGIAYCDRCTYIRESAYLAHLHILSHIQVELRRRISRYAVVSPNARRRILKRILETRYA